MVNLNARTILIVEDDFAIRISLKEMLEFEGYIVATASNGMEALNYLRSIQTPPKLVLLDMMMPVMDGAGFLNVLTNDTVLAGIPVYLHSAHADIENVKGAAGILKKPANYDAIIGLAEKYCK